MHPAEFYDLCSKHDWTYQFSDDYSVWERGHSNAKKIQSIAAESRELTEILQSWLDYKAGRAEWPTRPEGPTAFPAQPEVTPWWSRTFVK